MFGNLNIEDKSKVKNPKEFNSEISDELLEKFDKYRKELNFNGISYSLIHYRLKDKFPENSKNIILLRTPMDPEFLRLKPEYYESEGLLETFEEIITKVYKLSDFLRENGFFSEVVDPLELEEEIKKCAEDSKTGRIGRNKAVIFEEGPAPKIFAIATSITNFPKVRVDNFKWIVEYCLTCGKCNMHCPEKAFDHKGNLIEEKCTGYHEGCEICIDKCPFYSKDYETIKRKYDLKIDKMTRKSIF